MAHGLPQSDLFLHLDLVEASGYSLARVASTIIALVQMSDSSPHSATPKTLPSPVQDHISATQIATGDLEEWVEHFMALTRQKMISDQLVDGPHDEGSSEQESEFVRLQNPTLVWYLRAHLTAVEQQGADFGLGIFMRINQVMVRFTR